MVQHVFASTSYNGLTSKKEFHSFFRALRLFSVSFLQLIFQILLFSSCLGSKEAEVSYQVCRLLFDIVLGLLFDGYLLCLLIDNVELLLRDSFYSDSNRRRCSVLQWHPDVATRLVVASDDDSSPSLKVMPSFNSTLFYN